MQRKTGYRLELKYTALMRQQCKTAKYTQDIIEDNALILNDESNFFFNVPLSLFYLSSPSILPFLVFSSPLPLSQAAATFRNVPVLLPDTFSQKLQHK